MKVGINAQPLSRRRTGIGNYIRGLVQLLPQLAPQHDYFLYSNRDIDLPCPNGNLREQIDHGFQWCPGALWLMGRGGTLARRDQMQVFWSTSPLLPFGIPAGVLKVVTVYDLVWLRFPETTTSYNLFLHKVAARRAIGDADLIVLISRTMQDELIKSFGVPREKTSVVYPVISETYKPQDPLLAAEYISAKYVVPRRYLAAVGTIEPRKNLKVLIKALRILKRNNQLEYPLLIVGASGWKNSDLFREIHASGLTEREIQFLGYLADEDMPAFYAGAQLFLFPSVYEGFGLPPVEAMACGTPVIASNAPSMPEVLGDAAILVTPTSAAGFATAIVDALTDEKLRNTMREKGIRQAQKFNREGSVRKLLETLTNKGQSVVTPKDERVGAPVKSL